MVTRQSDGVDLLGRLLLSSIFIVSGVMKFLAWDQTLGYVMNHGIPVPSISLFIAAAIEIVCGLAILLGFVTRTAATVLFVYLIPVTLVFHSFWSAPPAEVQPQIANFLKNLTIMGGLLVLAAHGPGRLSIDVGNEEEITEEEEGFRDAEAA